MVFFLNFILGVVMCFFYLCRNIRIDVLIFECAHWLRIIEYGNIALQMRVQLNRIEYMEGNVKQLIKMYYLIRCD